MKLATTTGDFSLYSDDSRKLTEYVCRSGFRCIDYNFGCDYKNKSGAFTENWKNYAQDLKCIAEKYGAEYIQAHAPMGAPIAKDNKEFILDNIRCIEFCYELGIKNLVVHSGYDYNLTKEQTFYKNKLFYNELLKYAEHYEINILTENFNKMYRDNVYWIDNAPDLLELILYVDHPLFQAVWDTGHGNMQEMPQHESLKILGKYVRGLHIQDNFGDKDSHIAPYFGSMNLDSLMAGLMEIGYKGYFTFEAGNFFSPVKYRREYDGDSRLLKAPLELRIKAENLLYETGKTILEAYDCFEE